MDSQVLDRTRRSLHGLAELVLAGPQYRQCGTIRLRVVPGGFGTVATPDLRVTGVFLDGAELRLPIDGSSCSRLAAAVGVSASRLQDVYRGGPDVGVDEVLRVDPEAAQLLCEAFARGDAALRELEPSAEPVLWPEHLDIGITVDEINYGVSPGDAYLPEPYAYVGPWRPLDGEFWNASFGAARPLHALGDITAFFQEGRLRAGQARRVARDGE
jgi:hypothetical protein